MRRRSRNAAAVHKSTLAGLRADVAALAAAASDEVSNVGMVADLALRRLAEAEAKAARGEKEIVAAVLAQMTAQGISDRQARLLLGELAEGVKKPG